jgi:tetratricopeptide (TPR) repeat protein
LHRNITIGFCVLQLLISGCISAAVTRNHTLRPASRSATAPLPLSDYIRTVYRISQEGALEHEDQRQKVLQSRPDLAELASCVAADAADIECRAKLGEAYTREGLLWSAYTLFNEVLKLDAEEFRATLGLARIWDQWKDYSMARRLADAAIAINPKSAEAHELMGNIELHLNMPAAALAEFKKSLELAPGDAVVRANYGYAQMLLHNWPQAKASLEKALDLDRTLAEARNNLGIVLAQMGDYEGAIAQMQQVSGPAVAYNNLGVVLLLYKKEPAAALHAFEQALQYDPDYDKARANLETTRALLPAPVVVHLPPRQSRRVDPLPLVSAAPVDLTEAAAPATEQVRLPKGTHAGLEGQPSPIEPEIRTINTRGPVPSIATVVRTPQPFTSSSRHLSLPVRSFPSLSSSTIAVEHIRVYAILATLGLILITSVTSRCILSRMAAMQRSL